MLHKFRMVQHIGSDAIDLYLDDMKVEGVTGIALEAQVNEIPRVIFEVLAQDVETELESVEIVEPD